MNSPYIMTFILIKQTHTHARADTDTHTSYIRYIGLIRPIPLTRHGKPIEYKKNKIQFIINSRCFYNRPASVCMLSINKCILNVLKTDSLYNINYKPNKNLTGMSDLNMNEACGQ